MVIFSLVFLKVFNSLLSVVVGYGAGRFTGVDKDSIAKLLFYFVAPIVFFAIPTSTQLTLSDLGITLIVFVICSVLVCFSYWLYGCIWQDNHRNILALSAGTANGGYVALPIATALLDDKALSIYILGIIGVEVCEASVGLYFCLRSSITKRDSLKKILRLPILNAFFIGCIFSLAGFRLPDFFDDFVDNMKASFSILGMIMVGLALSSTAKFKIDVKFTTAAFLSKFIFFPLGFYSFILLDTFILGWYDNDYYNALQLCSLAPMATNLIVISSLYRIHPDKVATSVLLSLLFVLIYMPVMSSILLSDL